MQLTDKDLESFQALYKTHFNKDISRAEALAKGTQLLTLMKAVYKPMTQEEYDLHTDEYVDCIKKAYNENITQKYIKEYLAK